VSQRRQIQLATTLSQGFSAVTGRVRGLPHWRSVPRIRNMDDPDELRSGSAEGLEWIGRAPTTSDVVRVRDILLVPTSTAEGDWQRNPPVEDAVDLGRSLSLVAADHDEAELVMNACTPRGHFFLPVRLSRSLYAFSLEVDLATYAEHHFRWDKDGVLLTALQLSRLVCDNGYTTEYAARMVNYEDGQRQVIPQGQHYFAYLAAYRLRDDRDWLTIAEAEELQALLGAYFTNMNSLPPQVNRAISLSEGVVHQAILERALVMLFMGIEALLNTGKHQVTKQITKRMVMLADEVGIEGVSRNFATLMYGDRSSPAHGQELRLQATTSAKQRPRRTTDLEPEYLARVSRLQDLLRAATRKSIEEPSFAAVFADVTSIRARFPVTTLVGEPPAEVEL
jgi:hypothetical protein